MIGRLVVVAARAAAAHAGALHFAAAHVAAAHVAVTVTAVFVAFSTPARATCVDYDEFAHWSGGVVTPGSARNVAISGTLAFVADGNAGLTIVDVTDSAAPFLVSTTALPNPAADVTVVGDFAYLACGSAGLVAVDVSDPAAPVITRTEEVIGVANTIGSNGDFVYLGSARLLIDGRLFVFDVSFPSFPILRGLVWLPAEPRKLIVRGSTVYFTEELCFKFGCLGGLGSYDVSDPDNPVELGYITTGPSTGGDVQDGFGYVCSENFGLWIVDTSDPTDLTLIRSLPNVEARDIAVFRDRAYMADEGLQIATIVSDPDVIEPIDIPTPPSGLAGRVVLDGDRAYILDNGSVQIARIARDETVPEIGHYPTPGVARDVVVRDDLAYVADDQGVHIVDLSKPEAPSLRSSTATPGEPFDVAVAHPYAYIADDAAGLTVLDVSDPGAPVVMGSAAGVGPSRAVAVAPPYAYVAGHRDVGFRGFEVFVVSDPALPTSVAWISLPESARDIVLDGTMAYVPLGDAGLGRIDITIPETPVLLDAIDLGAGYARAFALIPSTAGTFGAVTGDGIGVKVIEMASGSIVATVPLPGNGRSIDVSGDFVVVGTDGAQMIVLSIATPKRPVVVGGLNARGTVAGIDAGAYLVLAAEEGGLGIFSTPCGSAVSVGELDFDIAPITLLSSVPNPFHAATHIPYVVNGSGAVQLRVFDASGRLTRTLVDQLVTTPGTYETSWDGRSDAGHVVPPGVYFFRLQSGTHSTTGKALRLP